MTIHSGHPFAVPEEERDQARRLRGRLGGAVTLWTSGEGAARSGLTVSSVLVASGEPAYVLGLLDPDSDLAVALGVEGARCVVQLLHWPDRDLAEQFAGLMPAPGGLFAAASWEQTPAGPRLAQATTWVEGTVVDGREVGWSREVRVRVDSIVVGEEGVPLGHRRGRYLPLGSQA